MNKTVKQGC